MRLKKPREIYNKRPLPALVVLVEEPSPPELLQPLRSLLLRLRLWLSPSQAPESHRLLLALAVLTQTPWIKKRWGEESKQLWGLCLLVSLSRPHQGSPWTPLKSILEPLTLGSCPFFTRCPLEGALCSPHVLQCSPAERDLGASVDGKLNGSQPCALMAKRATRILAQRLSHILV